MSSAEFPLPDLDLPSLRPFWQAAAQKRLELPRCKQCGVFNWYPADACPHCDRADFEWVEVAPRGTLFSWSVVKRPLFAPYARIAPYVPALIELPDAPNVRLVTRLVDCDPQTLVVDAPVELLFADLAYPHNDSGVIAPLAVLSLPSSTHGQA